MSDTQVLGQALIYVIENRVKGRNIIFYWTHRNRWDTDITKAKWYFSPSDRHMKKVLDHHNNANLRVIDVQMRG